MPAALPTEEDQKYINENFPGEETAPEPEKEAVESSKPEAVEAQDGGPWTAMLIGADRCFEIVRHGFKLQADADAWIKANIGRDQRMVSMRIGNAFESQTIARQVNCVLD